MAERKPIFYDQERRRWRRTRLALEIAGGFFTLVLVIFVLIVQSVITLIETRALRYRAFAEHAS